MKRALKLALAGALVALVAGCGGNGILDLFETGQYGAIATSHGGTTGTTCGDRYANIVANHSSEASATSAAINECRRAGGRGCSTTLTFGSAYAGAVDCGALAYGTNSAGQCLFVGGTGNSLSAAEVDALNECRSDGFSCQVVPTTGGGRFALCAR